jgi:2-phospho-L-lactate guanylyltransferase
MPDRDTGPVTPSPAPPLDWAVVVPVKRLAVAKSRLAAFGDTGRQRLALAFALDVVRAAVASPLVRHVLVVTDDARAAQALAGLGADVQADLPDAGLNPALEHGVTLLRSAEPHLAVATLSSDLPALRPGDVTAVLAATTRLSFVADAAGKGTTLLAAARGVALRPEYGPGSASSHRASGAQQLAGTPALRRDVDTPADLVQALALGLGPSTAAVLTELGIDVVGLAAAGARLPGKGTMHP